MVENIVHEYRKAELNGSIGMLVGVFYYYILKTSYNKHDLSAKFDIYNFIKEELLEKVF